MNAKDETGGRREADKLLRELLENKITDVGDDLKRECMEAKEFRGEMRSEIKSLYTRLDTDMKSLYNYLDSLDTRWCDRCDQRHHGLENRVKTLEHAVGEHGVEKGLNWKWIVAIATVVGTFVGAAIQGVVEGLIGRN